MVAKRICHLHGQRSPCACLTDCWVALCGPDDVSASAMAVLQKTLKESEIGRDLYDITADDSMQLYDSGERRRRATEAAGRPSART